MMRDAKPQDESNLMHRGSLDRQLEGWELSNCRA